MQLFTNSKRLAVPAIYLILYPLLNGMDLFTTYLASPNLKFEANPIIRYFKWGWTEVLTCAFFMTLLAVLLTMLSNKYIVKYFKDKKQSNKFLFYLSYFVSICFYGNFLIEIALPVNNYLSYLYLFPNPENIFQKIAVNYVGFYMKFNDKFGDSAFFYTANIIICILGIIVTIFQINRVKKYVQTTLPA